MARGAKTLSARPPPQAWLANCLDPTARVVTVSAKELGAMIEAREAKIPKSAPSRATAKRGRGEGSGAKYTVTEQEGFVWVKCDECSKRRYAPEAKAEKSAPDAKWKVRRGVSNARPMGSFIFDGDERVRDRRSIDRFVRSASSRERNPLSSPLRDTTHPDLPFLHFENDENDTARVTRTQCEDMRDDSRPDVSCATPEDAFPRANYSVEGVPAPPPGWRREVIPRKTVSGADAYYYSPCGKRMRSKPDVQRFLDKSKEQGKYLDVGIESFDFATGDRRGVPAKAPERGGDATKTDAEAKDPARKPAKRAKKEEPAAKTAEPAPEGEPAKRGRGRPRRAEKAEGKKEEGDDEERAAAETADA